MAIVYLSPTGSDSYTYVQAQNPATPWLTPGKPVVSATAGDTVSMAAGTYTYANGVSLTKNLIWTGSALSNGHPTTIFDGAGATLGWTVTGTHTFTNIMWKNAVNTDPNAPFYLANSSLVATFTNCEWKNLNMNGGYFFRLSGTSALTFNGCLLNDVYCGGVRTAFMTFPNSGTQAIIWNNCVLAFFSSSTSQSVSFGSNTSHSMKNCIMYNVSPAGAVVTFGGSNNTVTNCDNYNITSVPAGTGNITSDPLFVDAANSNFNLRPTSPCWDTGTLV